MMRMDTCSESAMTMAPATKSTSATFRAALRPRLSLRNPPPADPNAAPKTAELTIRPCVQRSLCHNANLSFAFLGGPSSEALVV